MLRTCALLVFCALLMGCAAVRYSEPESGERARVRFALDSSVNSVSVVRSYEDENCSGEREWMRLVNEFVVRPDVRRLGMPLSEFHENGAQEFYVRAEHRHFFMFEGASDLGNMRVVCAVPLSFVPRADQDYEIVLSLERAGHCQAVLSQLVDNGAGGAGRQHLNTFENVANAGCMRAFERARWF